MTQYTAAILGLLALCLLSVGLAVFSGMAKGKAGLVSGPVPDARDDNRLYRIDRVHMNSVEALAPFAVPVLLAMLVGVDATLLAILVWLHVVLRLAHLAIYLRGGKPATGGNVRTIIYLLAALTTLATVVLTALAALS